MRPPPGDARRPEIDPLKVESSLQASAGVSLSSETTSLVKDIESDLRRTLPEQQQGTVIQVVRQTIERHASFSGPQPPPELLAQYEQTCPGWAARLLEMGEREQLHRIECERMVLDLNRESLNQDKQWIDYSRTGQILGFFAFLVIAGIGVYALFLQMQAVALVCFGSFALGVIGLFIKGKGDAAVKAEPATEEVKEPSSPQATVRQKSRTRSKR